MQNAQNQKLLEVIASRLSNKRQTEVVRKSSKAEQFKATRGAGNPELIIDEHLDLYYNTQANTQNGSSGMASAHKTSKVPSRMAKVDTNVDFKVRSASKSHRSPRSKAAVLPSSGTMGFFQMNNNGGS